VPADQAPSVQVFGYRDSRPTQQAIRFFRDRRIAVSFVDLAQRPLARAELQRFSQKFGALSLLDETSKPYRDAGLSYLRLDEIDAFERMLADPRLLKLPLIRSGSWVAIGSDESAWRQWWAAQSTLT
jgi:arsenate reductase-like glutaredoxin family protein